MKERWKPIPGYEDSYQVSDRGRVRSIDRVVVRGKTKQPRRGKILRLYELNDTGYLIVQLKRKTFTVHGLVALAFIGPRPKKMDVAHIDAVRDNNKLSNLRYATRKENVHDEVLRGTWTRKLDPKEVLKIRSLALKKSQSEIGRRFGITQSAVSHIVTRRTWKHI